MNSWVFFTVLVFLNLLIGVVISVDNSDSAVYNYIYAKQQWLQDQNEDLDSNMRSSEHTLEEFVTTRTIGDENTVSANFWTILSNSFGTWNIPLPIDRIQALFVMGARFLNSLIVLYGGFLTFLLFKNRKNT